MKPSMLGAAKRLTLLLVVLFGMAGCMAYAPAAPSTYSYYDSNGNVVYVTPRPAAPIYVEPMYTQPVYAGPPIFLNFGFSSWSRPRHRGWRGHGYRSHRGHGGGGWHGRRR